MVAGAIAALIAVVGATVLLASGSDDEAAAAEVLLEPATSEGPFPWTGSIAHTDAPTSVPLPPTSSPPATSTSTGRLTTVSGDGVGIYGGTMELAVCDKAQLVSFLEQNPGQGSTWADVLGIAESQIQTYVDSLTPVVLAADTRVTNHGYSDARATPRQAVLQAGTAVLVDDRGTPRVRCYCGNPLTDPVVSGQPAYTGPRWPGFTPDRIIVVQPAAQPIQQITTINISTGGPLVIPVGGTTAAPTTAPTTAPAPLSPGSTPPPGSAPTTSTPVAPSAPAQPSPSTTPPPPATGEYQLESIRLNRVYGGFIGDDLAGAQAVQPGTSTVGPVERQFLLGWDFLWPRETMQNRNRAMATVTFTQLPTTITAGTPAPLQVSVAGEWVTSGYGVDRDHTIALSGAGVTPTSRNVPGPPSGTVQGSISAGQGTSAPAVTGTSAVVQVVADIRFGSDHTGQLVVDLIYGRT